LDRVVSVKTSRFTRETDPQAAAAPQQNASDCSCLHVYKREADPTGAG
jgi:hypothetical protein